MANQISAVESNVRRVLDGKSSFLSLDFSSVEGREAALQCIESKQSLSRQLNPNFPDQREVLKVWVRKDYKNLLALNVAQRHKELVDIYLEQRFTEQMQQLKEAKDPIAEIVSIMHSYTRQQLLCYNYTTKVGEAVSYFDGGLGVPVKLKTQAKFKLKLIDALRLVERIDVELESVDLTLTVNFINNKITDCLRSTLLGIIDGKKLTYYDLPRYFGLIKDQLFVNLQKIFNSCGLAVADIEIRDISLTNNAGEQIENQYYSLAETARVKEFENRMEEASLRYYEKKAMIHAKYPSFQMGLTEAEKDRALERYLKRIGKEKENKANIKNETLDAPIEVKAQVVDKPSDTEPAPVPPQRSKKYIWSFIISAVIWVIASIVLCVIPATRVGGFVVLGAGAAILVAAAIAMRYELKHGVSKSAQADYEKKLASYKERNSALAAVNSEAVPLEDLTII